MVFRPAEGRTVFEGGKRVVELELDEEHVVDVVDSTMRHISPDHRGKTRRAEDGLDTVELVDVVVEVPTRQGANFLPRGYRLLCLPTRAHRACNTRPRRPSVIIRLARRTPFIKFMT